MNKIRNCLVVILSISHSFGYGQTFKAITVNLDSTKTFTKDKSTDRTYPLFLKAILNGFNDTSNSNYRVKVTADLGQSTVPASDFKLDFNDKTINSLNESDSSQNAIYLTIKKDSLEDRTRKLVLKVEIFKGDLKIDRGINLGRKQMLIYIKGIEVNDSLKAYNYLAYVGTNFDLVDGTKTKNLFFASNIFLPPDKKKSVGFYLSLYGNRTMSSNDTTGNVTRTTRIVSLTPDTIKRFIEQASLSRNQVSDNLGAFCSLLVRLGNVSNYENKLKLYYAPTLEFVWRRTSINSVYTNSSNKDSIIEAGTMEGSLDYSNSLSTNVNEFVFNVGFLGLMLVHESKEISVRVHASVGWANLYSPLVNGFAKSSGNASNETNYLKKNDMFFCGRAWITEPVTGLTLQAEITNTLNVARPFYGVTLSKAINFKSIGKIFQPIVPKGM